jgi:predicted nucleic acid-binding protein
MKRTILVDSGVIIEYLKSGKGVLPKAYELYKMQITTTTYSELLASSTFKDEGLEKEVIEFIKKYFEVVAIDEKTALEVAKILRNGDINLATAQTAGMAKVNDLEVLTDDKKQFKDVEELKFLEI